MHPWPEKCLELAVSVVHEGHSVQKRPALQKVHGMVTLLWTRWSAVARMLLSRPTISLLAHLRAACPATVLLVSAL